MCKLVSLTFCTVFKCLFVLRLNVPVNNFSVMSGQIEVFGGWELELWLDHEICLSLASRDHCDSESRDPGFKTYLSIGCVLKHGSFSCHFKCPKL